MKTCSKCGATKNQHDFPWNGERFRPECRECNKRDQRAAYARDPKGRAWRLRAARYNLTREQYDEMVRSQSGRCAICQTDKPGGTGLWHIDHDHSCCAERKRSCGKCVRGLLCSLCNTGLGSLGDNPERLEQAIAYLHQWESRKVTG